MSPIIRITRLMNSAMATIIIIAKPVTEKE